MAFSLTYQSILDKNIRHVYSGNPAGVLYRHSKEYPNMDQLRQQKDNQKLKDQVLRMSEYREDYRCLIPRAPAFRQLTQAEVDEIVDRLHQPKPSHDEEERKDGDDKKISKEEMEQITERLHRTGTKMSAIRVSQTQESKQDPQTVDTA